MINVLFLQVGSSTINHLIGELRIRNNFTGYTDLDDIPIVFGYEYTLIGDSYLRRKTIDVLSKTVNNFLAIVPYVNPWVKWRRMQGHRLPATHRGSRFKFQPRQNQFN